MSASIRVTQGFLVVACFVMLTGCATLLGGGSSQDISFASQPSGASVSDNGQALGSTPVLSALSRKNDHLIRIELDGYEAFELQMTKGTNGWVWGNLVFGLIPGLIVDLATGAIKKLEPAQIIAQLNRSGAVSAELKEDQLYVFVTLEPIPGASVGNLKRE